MVGEEEKKSTDGFFRRVFTGKEKAGNAVLLAAFFVLPVAFLLLAAVFVLLGRISTHVDVFTGSIFLLIPELAVVIGVAIVWRCAFNQPFRWLGYAIRVMAVMVLLMSLLVSVFFMLFMPEILRVYQMAAGSNL